MEKDHISMSSRAKKNWGKVKNLLKGLKNSNNIDSKCLNSQHQKRNQKINFFTKKQQIISGQQKDYFVKKISNISNSSLGLVNNCQIVKTVNQYDHTKHIRENYQQNNFDKNQKQRIISNLILNTYRPVPSVSYLANQPINHGDIDTTGVWVWEAQQLLAYYLLAQFKKYKPNSEIFSVIQIGAGCSGLAALVYAKLSQNLLQNKQITNKQTQIEINSKQEQHKQSSHAIIADNAVQPSSTAFQHLNICITDGKAQNITYLKMNSQENFYNQQIKNKLIVQGFQYIWGQELKNFSEISYPQNRTKVYNSNLFDLILAADCLFFENYHNQLIDSLEFLLKPEKGLAVFVNPKRGNSVQNFFKKIHERNQIRNKDKKYLLKIGMLNFQNQLYEAQMKKIRESPQYDANTNQFMFIAVSKVIDEVAIKQLKDTTLIDQTL